jgi:hypothetical protein
MTLIALLPSLKHGLMLFSRRLLASATSLRVTLGYAVTLLAVSLTLTTLGARARDAVVSDMSTNLRNLAHGRLGTLIGSAFVSDGGEIYVWLPGLVCLLGVGELLWRSGGLLVTFAVGHVGTTLLVALWLTVAVAEGWLPLSVALASDVGVSYGAVCVLGALTAAIPSRWRPTWIGWWLGIAVGAAFARDFTGVGHLLALLLGMSLSCRLRPTAPWTPIRITLLCIAVTFGYFLVAGSSVAAPVAGVAAALIALLAVAPQVPPRLLLAVGAVSVYAYHQSIPTTPEEAQRRGSRRPGHRGCGSPPGSALR